MVSYRKINYRYIEKEISSYIEYIQSFKTQGAETEVAALSFALEILEVIPDHVSLKQYEKQVFLALEGLAEDYQGDYQDYGYSRGAILAVVERLRCLFYAHEAQLIQMQQAAFSLADKVTNQPNTQHYLAEPADLVSFKEQRASV